MVAYAITQFKEQKQPSQPYLKHIKLCGVKSSFKRVEMLNHTKLGQFGNSRTERTKATDQYQR